MGFGFNLFMIFFILPLTLILLISWLFSQNAKFGKLVGIIWLGIFGLIALSYIGQWLFSKKVLDKKDYYGEYVINRNYFKGEQADWQYNNFRFEITNKDSIFFHVTDKEQILKTYRGSIRTTTSHKSARLKIFMEQPTHHVLSSYPTIYRDTWSFYLVFRSPEYSNMFFTKGKWEYIE